jgi:hypothetical protein
MPRSMCIVERSLNQLMSRGVAAQGQQHEATPSREIDRKRQDLPLHLICIVSVVLKYNLKVALVALT